MYIASNYCNKSARKSILCPLTHFTVKMVENNRLRKIMTKWEKYREVVVLNDLILNGNNTIIQQRQTDKFSKIVPNGF